VKAAGEDHTVTLADLVAGYQLKTDYDRDKTALANNRRALEAEQTQRVQAFQQQSTVLANQFMLVENTLLNQLRDPKVMQLQTDDPAQFLMLQRNVEGQINQLRAARQYAAQQYDQTIQQNRAEFMRAEGAKLRDSVEGWGDEKLRASVETIKTLGFSDDEVVQVIDSRFIKGALELAQLRSENAALRARIEKGEKAATDIKRTVPKGIKPGKSNTGQQNSGPNKEALSKLKRRFSQTHHERDAAKLIEALL
jgi:hypothetical protein